MNKIALVFSLLFSTLLVACGGGGGGDDSGAGGTRYNPDLDSNYFNAAQGFYSGTISTGYDIKTLILEKDQYWSVYGYTVNGVFDAYGLIQGNGIANNGSYSASDLRDFDFNGVNGTRSISASYQVGSSFNGSMSNGLATATFTGAVLPKTEYDYAAPAYPGNITGTWSVTDLGNFGYTLTVLADGTYSASDGSCNVNGAISPRSSVKNVFDVVLNFGPACSMPNKTVSGVAVEYRVSSNGVSRQQLIIAGVNATGDTATVLVGMR